ncbi:carboxymuconolactone decarboxylase family protein [Cellulomonas composti]|uniref:Alkyl hydroperoxide reductase AhpD n=1 Tax=Cellulomonas composti TaxID=266130 RepID=A0A511JDB9_9CELL|nr:carboxymuconolactone decarboxylase family protein [Cellulomonas composti]GEL95998.1 alkyl hydroperoxide reductase AhpD [Cellulomonas composti]
MSRTYATLRDEVLTGMGELTGRHPAVLREIVGRRRPQRSSPASSSPPSAGVRELIVLGVAIAVRCDGCVDCHVQAALDAGATPAEIAETVDVAIRLGDGSAVVCGVEALEALARLARRSA